MSERLTPDEDAADSLASYDDAMRAIGERVKGGAPLPAFLLSRKGHFSAVALELPEGLPFEDWLELGGKLRAMERGVMWWIGDWLRYGERSYGEQYTQALASTDYTYGVLRRAKYVAAQFAELFRRRNNLSWAHHEEVGSLLAEQQDEMLDCATNQGWSHKDLRSQVSRLKNLIGAPLSGGSCHTDDLHTLIAAGRQFGTIYADPPWPYDNQGTRAATGNHYGGMTVDEIAALPIADLAAPNAHLHLWTTNGFLFECRRIMEAWGFEYKSCFVWVKPGFGTGNYWRLAHEFMLFGVRGSAPFQNHGMISWGEYERGPHSTKPAEIRELVEKASPEPRLELFARRVAPGWTVWGDSIERDLFYAAAD